MQKQFCQKVVFDYTLLGSSLSNLLLKTVSLVRPFEYLSTVYIFWVPSFSFYRNSGTKCQVVKVTVIRPVLLSGHDRALTKRKKI